MQFLNALLISTLAASCLAAKSPAYTCMCLDHLSDPTPHTVNVFTDKCCFRNHGSLVVSQGKQVCQHLAKDKLEQFGACCHPKPMWWEHYRPNIPFTTSLYECREQRMQS
ncbi:hypothetical protein BDV28DRAFT_133222 [Aspergillus coremiiformis]|uniref:Uncharacterized protein n=1 Tax=Aspergillus coremiiformis TaxID=138285 RepID=A0A5N6Z6U5_9EURO|nr:hypothetical protein BDV28DRAFT_133222 [Aspergillus coremiiformis]